MSEVPLYRRREYAGRVAFPTVSNTVGTYGGSYGVLPYERT